MAQAPMAGSGSGAGAKPSGDAKKAAGQLKELGRDVSDLKKDVDELAKLQQQAAKDPDGAKEALTEMSKLLDGIVRSAGELKKAGMAVTKNLPG